MKNKFLTFVCILIIPAVTAWSWGIGLQLDAGFSGGKMGGGPSVTFKLDSVPLVFAVNLDITENYFTMGLTADHWIFNKQIHPEFPVQWFVGYGAFGRIGFGDINTFVAGARLPIGINAFFADGFFEPYLQVAPSMGIRMAPGFRFPEWYLPFSLGFRLWF